MSNSSQPEDYSITLNEAMIAVGGAGLDTITISNNAINYPTSYTVGSGFSSNDTITITGGISGISGLTTTTIGPITTAQVNSYTWAMSPEWEGCFPSWDRVQKMCEKYPSLEIALRNFKTIYQLVKDDYDNPVPKK